MKKVLSSMFLVAFIVFCFTGQSWAFGWRHHHGGGNRSSSSTDNTGEGANIPGTDGNGSGSDSGPGGNGSGPNFGSGGNGNNGFPAAPTPEPMTLSLLGTGLAGIFLKRKIR